MDRLRHDNVRGDERQDDNRTRGWSVTRNEAALLGAIIGYGILVVVVTPLLLGFLPILAIGWMLRIPVTSAPADIATADINAVAPATSVTTATEAVASPAATERRTAIAVEAS